MNGAVAKRLYVMAGTVRITRNPFLSRNQGIPGHANHARDDAKGFATALFATGWLFFHGYGIIEQIGIRERRFISQTDG